MSDVTIQSQPTYSVTKSTGSSVSVTNSQAAVTTASVAPSEPLAKADSQTQGIVSLDSNNVAENAEGSSSVGGATVSSNIFTYRDSDSGRLVVKVIDENNNAVISEFPSKTMLGNYPKANISPGSFKITTDA
ncbi:flagellar protein FlaG [Kiloniella sp.]|uniref:flagellar protein FlaG n=1 Tax=Kiloniella sp. TaxID=1938587 RepID=UPI003A933EAA